MKCLSLYNSLFVREAADSNQCQAAKDSHGLDCCFEKCNMCKVGFLDSTAKVNVGGVDMSCSALDMSFSKDVIVEGSAECTEYSTQFAEACCYTIPDVPCRVCPSGSDIIGDVSVDFYGETKSCTDIGNKLSLSEEATSETCSATQRDFAEACCFETCDICPEGFNLNWGVDVEYNRATVACGEFDSIIRGNAIQKGSQECSSIRSTYSSACCYNYATASGLGYATETTLAQVTTTGYLSTNLDVSGLTSEQKEDAKSIFALLIKNTLESEGVLPKDSKVTVTDIDANGVVHYEIEMYIDDAVAASVASDLNAESTLEDISNKLSLPSTLEVISKEIKDESAVTSVAEELSGASVQGSQLGEPTVTSTGPDGSTEVAVSGILDTNIIGTSSLTPAQKEEITAVVESSIEQSLQSEGVLPQESTVTVNDIDDGGDVYYDIELSLGPESGPLEDISNKLSLPSTLEVISKEIKDESAVTSVAEELSGASVQGSQLGEPTVTSTGPDGSTEVAVSGILDTNIIGTSSLTPAQKEEITAVVESSIEQSLQSEGVLPQESTVTVNDIDDGGDVYYDIELSLGPESGPPEETTLEAITDTVVGEIDSALSKPATLETIANDLQTESAGSSVADELQGLSISDFVQGETSVVSTGSATGSGPCNLCKAGEIGLDKDILFNGAETSCPEVYSFLSTQAGDGSAACLAGKEALHDECCMRKCDICSGGGIPDWYSMVSVNGNSMTCLELDGIITESEIQSGSEQCSQLLEVAAPSCCYEPPSEPCNLCQNGSESFDVMSTVTVDYGGTQATCGQIFNTLFSREEHESETCSLIKKDLASQCCYNKCSLCGGLQTNAELTVMHDETQLGCSEFDSYIFASNLIEEGTGECKAFQDEHKDTCCYDVQCSLCSKGDDIYTTKETSVVQFGGDSTTCGEVANFLYQQEMSQGNACLAAQENIFSDCCFQQCELCEAGATVNWAATTSFNGMDQSCTDIYWLLISESVEAGTQECSSMSQVSNDCCYEVPSQQCTLCKDDNGANYNTRWNKEVTVNGMTKTCGDFNSLLATQENDSQTCSMAKETIFHDCCFAGSDTLVAIANQLSTENDAPCNLCQPGQVGINGDVVFNNNPTTCEEVYNFLIDSFTESETTCKSAQVKLSEDCCREQDQLSPSDKPAFGGDGLDGTSDGQGSVTAEKPSGEKVTPPMEFDGWTRWGGAGSARLATMSSFIVGALSFGLFMLV